MYWLELAGEDDAFAAYEAASIATGVELLAPGIARAGHAGPGVARLAYTRTAIEALGRTDARVESAVRLLEAATTDDTRETAGDSVAIRGEVADSKHRRGGDRQSDTPEAVSSRDPIRPNPRDHTVAVRARDVRGTAGVSTRRAERELGRVLVERGFTVDLDAPDRVLRALFAVGSRPDHEAVAGADGETTTVCALGWVAVEVPRDFAPEPTDRPFFHPGSMASADARAYVNVAGAGPGRRVLDPMCGTGGLPIEAGLVGARVLATDAQPAMVSGTRKNLQAYVGSAETPHGDPHWHVAVADATTLPVQAGAVDCVVFDAPYGRQSKIAKHDLSTLIEGALEEAVRVSERAVLVGDRDWQRQARAAGWQVDAAFERRVHRSLTRHILALRRLDSIP